MNLRILNPHLQFPKFFVRKMSYTYRGTTYYIQPKTNYLMIKGGTRPDGTFRKDRRINESFFKSQVLETYVSPPQREENYEKLLQAWKVNGHVNEALFRAFSGQPPPNSPRDPNYDQMLQGLESLSITVENDQRSVTGELSRKSSLSIEAPEFHPKNDGNNNICICQRPDGLVVCGFCGSYCVGRLVKVCNVHRETRFEDDVDICPICSEDKYLNENDYPMPK